MDKLLMQMLVADNGSWIDGLGYVRGYEQASIIRTIANLINQKRAPSSIMEFNVVRFFQNGVKLNRPIFIPTLCVTTNLLESPAFVAFELLPDGGRSIKVAIDKVINISFNDYGINVIGLESVMAAPTLAGGHNLPMICSIDEADDDRHRMAAIAHDTCWSSTYVYQRLLLTNRSLAQLNF